LRNGALFFWAGGDEEKAAKRKGRRAVLAQYQQQQDREACRDHKQARLTPTKHPRNEDGGLVHEPSRFFLMLKASIAVGTPHGTIQ
jgi:hypothetical protein